MSESQIIQLATVVILGLITLGLSSALADEGEYLWAPTNMVAGENYEGVVIFDIAKHGQMLILSTNDPTILKIPESVTIMPDSNQGIFSIKAMKEGSATIFAVTDGQIIQKTVNIYSSSRIPESLRIIVPANTTKTENMLGYVMTADSKNSPAPASRDIKINLSSSPLIQINDHDIMIKQGSYLTKFSAKIKGSGKIFANSEGLRIGEQEITKIQDTVTVKVSVAPDIILENSEAYFFVWLEKDGKPYKPPYVVHAFLSSNNPEVIRFTSRTDVKHQSDSILQISLIDGVGKGSLISGNIGSAVITANVDEFGSAQTNAVVGPVLIDENFQLLESGNGSRLMKIEERIPNIAFVWLYPPITDAKGYGVVALYNMNFTKNTSTHAGTNGTSIIISNTINRLVPTPLDGRIISLTASGNLQYPKILELVESNKISLQRGSGHSHATAFEIDGKNQGEYIVSASGPGLERYQTKISIVPSYNDLYQLKIVSIPALSGNTQTLAMISVIDSSGALIDAQKMFAGPVEISASTHHNTEKITITSQNSAIYSGSIIEPSSIIFSSPMFSPIEYTMIPDGIAASVSIDAPNKVHISEKTPFAIHEVDSHGIPIRKINSTNISTTTGILLDGDYLEIDTAGDERLAAISRTGASSLDIKAFANNLDFSIVPQGVTNRVDREFEIYITSDVRGMDVNIESPFPYRRTGDLSYAVIPDKEGYFVITFTAFKKGYAPTKNTFAVNAEKIVSVWFRAFGNDGKEINIENQIEIGNTTRNIVTPYQGEFKSQFLKSQFPLKTRIGNYGYQLNRVIFGDQVFLDGKINNMYLDKDSQIIAKYDRMVRIDVEDATGAGFYPYGQMVILSVPPKDKFLFLIREVFDHWEGIPYNTSSVSFIASNDINAKAILREDYSFLMLLVGCGISAVTYFRFVWKKGISLLWYMRKIVRVLRVCDFVTLFSRSANMKKIESNKNNHDTEHMFNNEN